MTTKTTTIVPLPKPKGGRPTGVKPSISPALGSEIDKAWAEGRFATMEELASHYEVPVAKLRERFKRNGIRKGQAIEEYNKRLQEELAQRAAEDAKVLADRIRETKEEHYKMATGISKLVWAEVLTAKQKSAPFATIKENLKSLAIAMKTLSDARVERFAVLGLDKEDKDDDDTLPELLVSELTQEQIEEIRNRTAGDPDDTDLPDDLVPAALPEPGQAGPAGEDDDDVVME